MPDGRYAIYEHHNWRHQQLVAQGEAETRADLIEAGKARALAAFAELEDAIEEMERELPPGAMKHARLSLDDARTEVEGATP